MTTLTFKISEEDTNRIEGIYSDLTAYKSILAEMSNSSNTSDIGSTKTYSVFKELNKKGGVMTRGISSYEEGDQND